VVLENLFPENWLERKHGYAFLLACSYTLLSLLIARFIFPKSSGIVSVVFITLLLMPYMEKLIAKEEKKEEKEKKFSFKHLWLDNKVTFRVYVIIFAGVFLTYSMLTLFLPWLGIDTSQLFGQQLALDSLKGNAFSFSMFGDIFINNWWVLLAIFVIALLTGEGTLFFIIWNASVWGAIFGYRAFAAAMFMGTGFLGSIENFLLLFIIVLPHLVLETAAYLLAGISGEVLSDDIMKKAKEIQAFIVYTLMFVILYVLFSFLLRMILPTLIFGIVNILIIIGFVYCLKFVFDNKAQREVFTYNYWLFIIAVVIFVIAAGVETAVLMNSDTLYNIYMAAMGVV